MSTAHSTHLASFRQNAPCQSLFPADRGPLRATKKPASVSRPGLMRSFGECSFLKDSRYASQVIFVTRTRPQTELVPRRSRRGGKATGGGNRRRDARARID